MINTQKYYIRTLPQVSTLKSGKPQDETPSDTTVTTETTTTETSGSSACGLSDSDWEILEGTSRSATNGGDDDVPNVKVSDNLVLKPTNNNTVVTHPTAGDTYEFEIPSYEDFFNDVILAEFIETVKEDAKYAEKNQGKKYFPHGPKSAPVNYISLDENNNVLISEQFVDYVMSYLKHIVKTNVFRVNETKPYNSFDYSSTPGENQFAKLLGISLDEINTMTKESITEKLNNLFKKMGATEKDANGNYQVSVAQYYTFMSENYGYTSAYPRDRFNAPYKKEYGYIRTAEQLGEMYAAYCAKAYNRSYTTSAESDKYYVASILMEQCLMGAYRNIGVASTGYYHYYAKNFAEAVMLLASGNYESTEAGHRNGKKVANVIYKAAGITDADSEDQIKRKLNALSKQVVMNKNDGEIDLSIVAAYLISHGYNEKALYPEEEPPVVETEVETPKPEETPETPEVTTPTEPPKTPEVDNKDDKADWKTIMANAAKDLNYNATDITGKYTFTDANGTSFVCIWDPMNEKFMLFRTSSTNNEKPEFTEDDKTLKPSVEGYYAEANIAAAKSGFTNTKDFGLYEKDGELFEYDVEKKEFIKYDVNETYEAKFDDTGVAKKRTLANLYAEAYLLAMMLDYESTTRIGVFKKDDKFFEYNTETRSFDEI